MASEMGLLQRPTSRLLLPKYKEAIDHREGVKTHKVVALGFWSHENIIAVNEQPLVGDGMFVEGIITALSSAFSLSTRTGRFSGILFKAVIGKIGVWGCTGGSVEDLYGSAC